MLGTLRNKAHADRIRTCFYDTAGRLTTITQPGQPVENYTWFADGTLATLPGNGGTRTLEYDEEGRNTAIKYGSTVKFEFGYAYDGARRWTKDINANKWTWYPCGVACSAGELVEMSSDLSGASWTVSNNSLTVGGCGSKILRAGSDWNIEDTFERASAILSNSADIVASRVYDLSHTVRNSSGNYSGTILRSLYESADEDGLASMQQARALALQSSPLNQLSCQQKFEKCKGESERLNNLCRDVCAAGAAACAVTCVAICAATFGAACIACGLACTAGTVACYAGCSRKLKNDMSYCYTMLAKCQGGAIKPKPRPLPIRGMVR